MLRRNVGTYERHFERANPFSAKVLVLCIVRRQPASIPIRHRGTLASRAVI
jgi:hypothetical protein